MRRSSGSVLVERPSDVMATLLEHLIPRMTATMVGHYRRTRLPIFGIKTIRTIMFCKLVDYYDCDLHNYHVLRYYVLRVSDDMFHHGPFLYYYLRLFHLIRAGR